jgi:hypothetical protein
MRSGIFANLIVRPVSGRGKREAEGTRQRNFAREFFILEEGYKVPREGARKNMRRTVRLRHERTRFRRGVPECLDECPLTMYPGSGELKLAGRAHRLYD